MSFLTWYIILTIVCIYWKWTIPSKLQREYNIIKQLDNPYYRIDYEKQRTFESIRQNQLDGLEKKHKNIQLNMDVRELWKDSKSYYSEPMPTFVKVILYGLVGPFTIFSILSLKMILLMIEGMSYITDKINNIITKFNERDTVEIENKISYKLESMVEDTMITNAVNKELNNLLSR